jgi:ribonuclease VapC
MFVDDCAIIAILGGEPSAPVYVAEIDKATAPWTSSLAAWEAIIVL